MCSAVGPAPGQPAPVALESPGAMPMPHSPPEDAVAEMLAQADLRCSVAESPRPNQVPVEPVQTVEEVLRTPARNAGSQAAAGLRDLAERRRTLNLALHLDPAMI